MRTRQHARTVAGVRGSSFEVSNGAVTRLMICVCFDPCWLKDPLSKPTTDGPPYPLIIKKLKSIALRSSGESLPENEFFVSRVEELHRSKASLPKPSELSTETEFKKRFARKA